MILRFIDVFRFFTEIELTDTQRVYELVCVSVLFAVLAVTVTVVLVRKHKALKSNKETQDGTAQKSGH